MSVKLFMICVAACAHCVDEEFLPAPIVECKNFVIGSRKYWSSAIVRSILKKRVQENPIAVPSVVSSADSGVASSASLDLSARAGRRRACLPILMSPRVLVWGALRFGLYPRVR